jgi:hypothetical protein
MPGLGVLDTGRREPRAGRVGHRDPAFSGAARAVTAG